MPALRMPLGFPGFEVGVFTEMSCGKHQLKTYFFTAAPAKGKQFSLKQGNLMVFAVEMVQDKIKSRFGNSLARLISLFHHKFLPEGGKDHCNHYLRVLNYDF
jgi:hypothetical protein